MRFDPERGFDAEAVAALKAAGANDAAIARLESGGRDYVGAKRKGRVPKAELAHYKDGAERKAALAVWLVKEQRRGFDWPATLLAALDAERQIAQRRDAWARQTRLSKGRSGPDLLLLQAAILDAWRIAGHKLGRSTPSPATRARGRRGTGGPAVRFLQLAVRLIAGDDLIPSVSGAKKAVVRAKKHIDVKITRRADGRADVEIVGPRHVLSKLLKKI